MFPTSTVLSAGSGSNNSAFGPADLLQQYVRYSTAIQAVNRSAVAALTFLVWDILITTGDEVSLVWPRSWTLTKGLYFFVRYFPVALQLSLLFLGSEITRLFDFGPKDCFHWRIYQAISTSLIIIAVDVILILRVYALYHNNRPVRFIVGLVFLVEIMGMIAGLSYSIPRFSYNSTCNVLRVPQSLVIYVGSCIFFQTILFLATFYKFVRAVRSGWGDIPLVSLLMRDGTWAFTLLFVVYGGLMGLYRLPNRAFAAMLYGWLLSVYSFSGYRILLNINRLAEHTVGDSSDSTVRRTNTDIQFSTGVLESQSCPPVELRDARSFRDRDDQNISFLSLGR